MYLNILVELLLLYPVCANTLKTSYESRRNVRICHAATLHWNTFIGSIQKELISDLKRENHVKRDMAVYIIDLSSDICIPVLKAGFYVPWPDVVPLRIWPLSVVLFLAETVVMNS
jgi:hypothetical protein